MTPGFDASGIFDASCDATVTLGGIFDANCDATVTPGGIFDAKCDARCDARWHL